jgi:phosphohistidine phosphatase
MKTLLLLRHAKSSWTDPTLPDHDRPLNKRGIHDAPRMGKILRHEDLRPDLILSSTAVRAKKTAELVAKACKYKGEISLNGSMYTSEVTGYCKTMEDLSDRHNTVLVVGHSPSVEQTIKMLTNSPEILMPTCALAHIRLQIEDWAEINKQKTKGQLVKVWRPKELF